MRPARLTAGVSSSGMEPKGVLVLLFPFLLSACESMEMPEASYSSRSEVVQDRAIERGWVPSWLPETARDIHERHDLDTNISQLTFRFETLGSAELAENCAPIDRNSAQMPRKVLVDGWPPELRGAQTVARFSFHACSGAGSIAYLAVDEEHKRAYFWNP